MRSPVRIWLRAPEKTPVNTTFAGVSYFGIQKKAFDPHKFIEALYAFYVKEDSFFGRNKRGGAGTIKKSAPSFSLKPKNHKN